MKQSCVNGRPRLLGALAAATVVVTGAVFASAASATFQGYRTYSGGVTKQGVRATVWSPSSGEVSITAPDAFLSSVWADGTTPNGMQVGIIWVSSMPSSFDCSFGYTGQFLRAFVEVKRSGSYTCFDQGAASWSTSYLMTSDEGTDHYWRGYINGVFTNVRSQWPDGTCGYDACYVTAFGESILGNYGTWYAKFAGSGYSPWAVYNGSNWSTIGTSGTGDHADFGWSAPTGPYPGGIWQIPYRV